MLYAEAKASKQPTAKRLPSAVKQRPRYNVPVAFMSRGVVDPYELEQAVIEPPRRGPSPDQAAEPIQVELPGSRLGLGARAGLGAEISSTAMIFEEEAGGSPTSWPSLRLSLDSFITCVQSPSLAPCLCIKCPVLITYVCCNPVQHV